MNNMTEPVFDEFKEGKRLLFDYVVRRADQIPEREYMKNEAFRLWSLTPDAHGDPKTHGYWAIPRKSIDLALWAETLEELSEKLRARIDQQITALLTGKITVNVQSLRDDSSPGMKKLEMRVETLERALDAVVRGLQKAGDVTA